MQPSRSSSNITTTIELPLILSLLVELSGFERRPAKQRVAGSIPSQGTCLGCRARSLGGGAWEATTHWCFSPSLSPSPPFYLKLNKNLKKKTQNPVPNLNWKKVLFLSAIILFFPYFIALITFHLRSQWFGICSSSPFQCKLPESLRARIWQYLKEPFPIEALPGVISGVAYCVSSVPVPVSEA